MSLRVIEWNTTFCSIYRIWFTDKIVKYEPGEMGGSLDAAQNVLDFHLADGYKKGSFRELSPEEIENLKCNLL